MTTTTTIDHNPNSPYYGEPVRGFRLVFTHPGWRDPKSPFHSKAGKHFSLPWAWHPPYTGEEAIQHMAAYVKRGFEIIAVTESRYGGTEQLTLEEMMEIY